MSAETSGILEKLDFPIPLFLSTRYAGDLGPSWLEEHPTREDYLRRLGIDPIRLRRVRQIHSRIVRPLFSGSAPGPGPTDVGSTPVGDGMVTDNPADVLSVTVADCMPICLYDARRGVLALLHSGWRGTGIVRNALRVMAGRYGTKPGDVVAGLGPSIGVCCYRVDDARSALFARRFGMSAVDRREDGPYLDLRRANICLLEEAGIGEVRDSHRCTVCDRTLGSFRREGAERFTRMLALATLDHVELDDAGLNDMERKDAEK